MKIGLGKEWIKSEFGSGIGVSQSYFYDVRVKESHKEFKNMVQKI